MPTNIGYLRAKRDKASDEEYTPEYAVKPLLPHLKLFAEKCGHPITIWCPFDTDQSSFALVLRAAGYIVIATHIDDNESESHDFFRYEPTEDYDIIISNPPFSCKDTVIKRLYELNRPYMMLLPIPTLQGQKRYPYIKDCQALIFDKRINYFDNMETRKPKSTVSFGSFYLCRNSLEKDLIFEEIQIEK